MIGHQRRKKWILCLFFVLFFGLSKISFRSLLKKKMGLFWVSFSKLWGHWQPFSGILKRKRHWYQSFIQHPNFPRWLVRQGTAHLRTQNWSDVYVCLMYLLYRPFPNKLSMITWIYMIYHQMKYIFNIVCFGLKKMREKKYHNNILYMEFEKGWS